MLITKAMPLLALAACLAGCAGGDVATRAEEPASSAPVQVSTSGPQAVAARYDVQEMRVIVPTELRVSEANMFYPIADIVWRGEPPGNRHAQVAAILSEAMTRGSARLQSGPKVTVDVVVDRFHCLTEKTRYTVGGVHSMRFTLTVRDAATGAIVEGPRKVIADMRASGGARAMAEDEAGMTQRVVIVDHLARVIQTELSTPEPAAES